MTKLLLQKLPTQTPQPLKSGWSQVVKQQTRGTVSAPTSPSKKQAATPLTSFRRETAASSLGRRDWTESPAPATSLEEKKPRETSRSDTALAANSGRREAHAVSSEAVGAREAQSQSSQHPGKGEVRPHEGEEAEAAAPVPASMVCEVRNYLVKVLSIYGSMHLDLSKEPANNFAWSAIIAACDQLSQALHKKLEQTSTLLLQEEGKGPIRPAWKMVRLPFCFPTAKIKPILLHWRFCLKLIAQVSAIRLEHPEQN